MVKRTQSRRDAPRAYQPHSNAIGLQMLDGKTLRAARRQFVRKHPSLKGLLNSPLSIGKEMIVRAVAAGDIELFKQGEAQLRLANISVTCPCFSDPETGELFNLVGMALWRNREDMLDHLVRVAMALWASDSVPMSELLSELGRLIERNKLDVSDGHFIVSKFSSIVEALLFRGGSLESGGVLPGSRVGMHIERARGKFLAAMEVGALNKVVSSCAMVSDQGVKVASCRL